MDRNCVLPDGSKGMKGAIEKQKNWQKKLLARLFHGNLQILQSFCA
jgi:hypothetical protein